MTDTKKVDSILDGWFGEALEDAENEQDRRNYLYEPLRKLMIKAYYDGYEDGFKKGSSE
ncbi:hypothetical protein PHIM7_44 [Sinorhizobium phage phiM7]|uniref:Uncharacterized protein n=2 Tax=Emdodecavirus TaxID=1980937 RepID=S5MV11_9CAUD|nr:hypothetical protein AB690_gp050 [Sinorhizobium phage phiM12]YP_009601169.1 hypothetical protein FDH46_gp044 [Sinorhizobium phage phiM7]AGR47692.1 hypothetical protein SmphiM12_060 [Sinorhizobium phage phiM12]AKF12592.1 hypothetical protein PHIM7_44 [Sinorhizobium phage phiM7]AKF12952.1 hypothetical protein PHIM19_45 [Sinorhizobium phage phiM19]